MSRARFSVDPRAEIENFARAYVSPRSTSNPSYLTPEFRKFHAAWTPMKLDIFWQNLKYTLRTLARDRAFTVVAVLILALAIGANIACLQRGQHAIAAAIALSGFASVGMDRSAADWVWPLLRDLLGRRLRRISCGEPGLPGRNWLYGFLDSGQSPPHRARRARTSHRHRSRSAISSKSSACSRRLGRSFTADEARGGAASGRSVGQRLLAAPVRLRSSHRRQGHRTERDADHRRWRLA